MAILVFTASGIEIAKSSETKNDPCEHIQSRLDSLIGSGMHWENLHEYIGEIRDHDNCLNQLSFDGAHLDGVDLRQANLKGIYFPGARLTGALLMRAELQRSNLRGGVLDSADITRGVLSFAQLQEASLKRVRLESAILDNASLNGADLSNAILRNANLQNADLTNAILSDADLRGANLRNARLVGAVITGAKFADAQLNGAIFETRGELNARDFILARSVDRLIYKTDPNALYQLKDKLNKGGYANMERQVIAALNRNLRDHCRPYSEIERSEIGFFFSIIQSLEITLCHVKDAIYYLLFDLTVEYGANPLRAIVLFAVNLLVFTMFYWLVLRYDLPEKLGGISLVVKTSLTSRHPASSVLGKENSKQSTDLYAPTAQGSMKHLSHSVTHILKMQIALLDSSAPSEMTRQIRLPTFLAYNAKSSTVSALLKAEVRIFVIALKYSAYRAFHIGVSNLNIGDWIRMIRSRDYELVGRGSVRSIGGWQSLISTGLLALWLVSMFGKPFDF